MRDVWNSGEKGKEQSFDRPVRGSESSSGLSSQKRCLPMRCFLRAGPINSTWLVSIGQ